MSEKDSDDTWMIIAVFFAEVNDKSGIRRIPCRESEDLHV